MFQKMLWKLPGLPISDSGHHMPRRRMSQVNVRSPHNFKLFISLIKKKIEQCSQIMVLFVNSFWRKRSSSHLSTVFWSDAECRYSLRAGPDGVGDAQVSFKWV